MKFLILFFIPFIGNAQADSLKKPVKEEVQINRKIDKGDGRTFIEKGNPTIEGYHNRKLRLEAQADVEEKVYHTRAIIINSTNKKLKVLVKDITDGSSENFKITLSAGDTLDLGDYETTDGYDQLSSHYYIQLVSKKQRFEFAAKSEDAFPEGDLFKRLGVIELYRRTD